MKIVIDLDDPATIPEQLKLISMKCREIAEKIDPNKNQLFGGVYRVIGLHVFDYGIKLEKRLVALVDEYREAYSVK